MWQFLNFSLVFALIISLSFQQIYKPKTYIWKTAKFLEHFCEWAEAAEKLIDTQIDPSQEEFYTMRVEAMDIYHEKFLSIVDNISEFINLPQRIFDPSINTSVSFDEKLAMNVRVNIPGTFTLSNLLIHGFIGSINL